jgi:hypothetical protein
LALCLFRLIRKLYGKDVPEIRRSTAVFPGINLHSRLGKTKGKQMPCMDPPPWMDAEFRPVGSPDEVYRALRSAITADQPMPNLKIRREVDRFEAGGYRPEVTTNKSSGETILPELSDGTCLSRSGAKQAIDRAARAFNFEATLHQKASTPDVVSSGLADVAMKAQELANLLISLSQEARWRLATLPSVDLWPRSVGDSKLRYPNPFRMEPNQAEGLFRNISVEDSQFLHLRIGELIPSLSGSNPEESKWNHDLLELAEVFQKAAIATPGPGERRGARRRSNEFGAIGGFPLLLLIRECDSILCAADRTQFGSDLRKGMWAGRNSHRYHRGLKPFADAIFRYATGFDALRSLDRPFKEYSNSMNPHLDPHPYAWRSFRIAALRRMDYLMQVRTKQRSR